MSNRYWSLPGVRLEPGLCGRQLLLGLALALLASVATWMLAWHWLACLLLNIALAGLVGLQLWRQNRYCCGEPVAALDFDGRHWQLTLRNGRSLRLLPEPGPLLHSSVAAAQFRLLADPARCYRLFLFAHSQTREDWRRLSLALRYGERGGSRIVSLASAARSG